MQDTLKIADREFRSRLLIGTGPDVVSNTAISASSPLTVECDKGGVK